MADVRVCLCLLPNFAVQSSKPEMQTVGYKFGIVVSALLSMGLLFIQFCGAVCAFSGCLAAHTAPSLKQEGVLSHCHQAQPDTDNQLPHPPKNNQHSCTGHETAVMLPVRISLAAAVVSLHLQPVVPEPFIIPPSSQSVSDSADIWDSLRSPPRILQRSVLRI